jgi:mannose-6-phosphate isomerase-like protein (cupin superfamily)
MNCGYVKGMVVFVCLTVAGLISGCSMNKEITMPSGKAQVIKLSDNPDYQPLLTGLPQTCGMRSGRVYLKPGEECGLHSTENNEETLVFLSGKGTALIGEKQDALEVGQGKVCYIPPHTAHNISNTGAEPLVYIYCVAPARTCNKERHKH